VACIRDVALITLSALPISLAVGLLVLWALGLSINVMTLGGFRGPGHREGCSWRPVNADDNGAVGGGGHRGSYRCCRRKRSISPSTCTPPGSGQKNPAPVATQMAMNLWFLRREMRRKLDPIAAPALMVSAGG